MTPRLISFLVALATVVLPTSASQALTESSDALPQAMLAVHNAARAEVGVGPMRWNPALATNAAEWANHLATTGQFEHDRRQRDEPEGENLWMGTRGYYPIRRMAQAWVGEKKSFRPGRFPENSRTGSWQDVGHYTQIVWKDTHEVGCAIARNASDEVLVCRYAQAGNVMGQSPI